MPHSPGLGAIYGIVAENGVPQAGSPVHLLDRTGPKFIRSTQTREDGGFAFSGLNTETDDYMVIATDETGDEADPYKNALIRDRVQPVSVHVGTYYPSAWWSKAAAMLPGVIGPAPYADGRFNHVNLLGASNAQGVMAPQGGSWSYGEAAPFEDGAFNLPVIELTDSTWVKLYSQSNHIIQRNNTIFSVVVVADFSQAWGVTQRVISRSNYQIHTYRAPMAFFHLAYNGTATLRVELRNGFPNSAVSDAGWSSGSITKTYNHTLSPVPSGFAMVAFSLRGGSVANLYVDGNETVLDNTTVPTTWLSYSSDGVTLSDAALHGWNRAEAATGPKFALYLFSAKFLHKEELDDLRDALWNGGFPTETGYARALTVDLPCWYYRMDEVNPTNDALSEHYEGDVSSIPAADVLEPVNTVRELLLPAGTAAERTFVTGPTAGRSAALFNGNWVAYSSYVGVLPSYRNFTLAFWFRHDTRSGTQYLIHTAIRQGSTETKHFDVRITSGGQLQLNLLGADGLLTWDTVFDVGTWYSVAFVVEKTSEEARLYVNGVLAETKAVTTTALTSRPGVYDEYSTADWEQDYWRASLVLGGRLSGSSPNSGFQGALAEVAAFSYPLTAARIADHYANKDVI